MNEPTQLIDPHTPAQQRRLRVRELRYALKCYALDVFKNGMYAQETLDLYGSGTITDPVERHLVTYLRWYAAGNQDGGACARVALDIAG